MRKTNKFNIAGKRLSAEMKGQKGAVAESGSSSSLSGFLREKMPL
jgi:hypothetical protein